MNLNTLKAFRHEVYQSFKQAKNALFNLVDALASEDRARSLPELSLSPWFERKWPSLYEALEDGIIDEEALRRVFLAHLPQRHPMPLIAVDSTNIARPKARTSEDRSAQYVHNLPESAKPVTYGWQFSTVGALPEKPSGGTYVLDQCRVRTTTTAIQVAAEQLSQVAPLLPRETIALLDRGYDSAWLWCQLSRLPIQGSLIRIHARQLMGMRAVTVEILLGIGAPIDGSHPELAEIGVGIGVVVAGGTARQGVGERAGATGAAARARLSAAIACPQQVILRIVTEVLGLRTARDALSLHLGLGGREAGHVASVIVACALVEERATLSAAAQPDRAGPGGTQVAIIAELLISQAAGPG